MSEFSFQEIFDLQCLLKNINIRCSTRIESGVKQLLALITSDGDIVLHYTYGELPSVIKIIPWFTSSKRSIQAVCFDPTATWLLVVTFDGSVFIIPALSLVDKRQKIDCKWSISDLTHFPRHPEMPDARPTAVIWWQTLDCNQNALIGFETGALGLISLTDGKCLASCKVADAVGQLLLCYDNAMETISLLINGEKGQQWRLTLEQHSTGYLWPGDSGTQTEDGAKSRLSNLRQMGVDKLATFKQRLTEGRAVRRDSQTSDSTSESSVHSDCTHSGPELLPHLCDTYFSPQYAKNRYLFTAYYRPSSLLTIHAIDVETAPLYVHKLCPDVHSILLADSLIYVITKDLTVLKILSAQYTESRLEGDNEYNPLASVAEFKVPNNGERILDIYKVADLSVIKDRRHREDNRKERVFHMPKKVEDINVRKPRIDTCVVVTNCAVYKVVVRCCPITKFIHLITQQTQLEKAERLSVTFGLNMQQLLEYAGDILISNGSYHSGLIVYKQAKVHVLKRVLKLAVTADCKALLKFIRLCLSASKLDMSIATKIHIGNLAVMGYTETILRHSGKERVENVEDFMNFLCYEEYYDQILAVNVACQAGLWSITTLLAKARGLQLEVVAALCQILQTTRAPSPNDTEFTLALSEPSLTQCFLVCPLHCQIVTNYVKANVDCFPTDVLQRFLTQLDPSQPAVSPFVSRMFQKNRFSSSLDSTFDSVESDNLDRSIVCVKDLIETFVIVLLTFVRQKSEKFQLALLDYVPIVHDPFERPNVKRFPDLRPLGCGFEHAAIVRNNCVYTMGVSSSGCLGLGPLLTQSSPPRIVQTLADLKVKALSVSCGRRHTLLLTDCGVYSWGSNSHGQLGLGPVIQESPYPQLIVNLSHERIIDVVAGQYHSLALTAHGTVYSWGWGIHGQLGHGTSDNEYYPKAVAFKQRVMEVAAGHAHTLVLGTNKIVYGFGSNAFGQLEKCGVEGNKAVRPVRVLLMPDMYVPIEKIGSAYFHNIAIRSDQEVHIWGASPQEVRNSQSRQTTKPTNTDPKPAAEPWKSCLRLYTNVNRKPVDQVAVGYKQSVILHDGRILWSRSRDSELLPPKLRDQDGGAGQRFVYVGCGSDFTLAMEQNGRVFAWGSPSVAQTLLGKLAEDPNKSDGKIITYKNTRRVVKFPTAAQSGPDYAPTEVPNLPTMAITYNTVDHRTLLTKRHVPYAIRAIEHDQKTSNIECNRPFSKHVSPIDFIKETRVYNYGQKTLHYVLETYHNLYDTDNVIAKCLETGNLQAAAKLAMLDGHFGDSLGFQLEALKQYMKGVNLKFALRKAQNKSSEALNELNEKVQIRVEKSLDHNARILSSSSSLDSLRQWGDEEHQGGCESPCEMSADLGDVRQGMSLYVKSINKSENSPPISSVSKLIDDARNCKLTDDECKETNDVDIQDEQTKEIILTASTVVECYIEKIHASENHILMQNVLMKCIEFWVGSGLPIVVLENVLLKNMDKYFYPLSVLLFCKNFNNNVGEEIVKDDEDVKRQSVGFLKQFSTKFCLQLCAMVLENVNKA